MKLSIIVPVYNVESYLEKCLKSLVEQTLDKNLYEIIVINDGSPDNSQDIIERYAKEYSNIVPLQKSNGGLSDARNFGLSYAQGEYVAFVDSDDYVDVKMYKTMLEKASEKDFDVVVCDFIEIYDDYERHGSSRVKLDLHGKEAIRKAMLDFYPSAWNKIYKRKLFFEEQFKKGIWFEDVECLYRLFPLINSVGVVNEAFYYYMQRQGSISKLMDPRIFHCVENWNGLLEYYHEKNYFEEYKKELEFCYVRYIYATFIKAALKFDKENYRKALKTAMQEVKKHFKLYRMNSYFYVSFKGVYCVLFNRIMGEMLYFISRSK